MGDSSFRGAQLLAHRPSAVHSPIGSALRVSPWVGNFGSVGVVAINTATFPLPNSQTPDPVHSVRARLCSLPPLELGWGQATPLLTLWDWVGTRPCPIPRSQGWVNPHTHPAVIPLPSAGLSQAPSLPSPPSPQPGHILPPHSPTPLGLGEASFSPYRAGLRTGCSPPCSAWQDGVCHAGPGCWIGTIIQPVIGPGTAHPTHQGNRFSITVLDHSLKKRTLTLRYCHVLVSQEGCWSVLRSWLLHQVHFLFACLFV